RAGEKDQRQPEELVEDLGLLHGISDAGDDEAKRAKGNDAQGKQQEEREGVAKVGNVKDEFREEQFGSDDGQSHDVVGGHTGGEHVGGGDGRDMKAAQNALLAKHDECRAESPEAAHNVEGENGTKVEGHAVRVALGKDAGIEEEENHRHEDDEEEEHLVAERERNAHSGEVEEVFQSRSLLPVSSMKTSSSEGVKISRLTRSLLSASRCLTSETMACGGRWV